MDVKIFLRKERKASNQKAHVLFKHWLFVVLYLVSSIVNANDAGGTNFSGSLNASETESTSESNYYTNTQITAGALSSDSENLTLSGANVDAGVVGITTENLLVESLQNTSTSTSETKGTNVSLDGSGSPTSGGINQQQSESSTAWVDQQSGITGGDVTIKAKDTTIKGGLIAAVDAEGNDNGQLSVTTDTLSVEDLQDHSTSSDKGFSLNSGEGSTTVGANYSGHDTEQTTKATIGSGNVTVGGEQLAEGTVNRDINNSQEITKDHELGGLDATVTVDHRLATEEGREEIVSDIEDTVEIAQKAAETAVHTTTFVVEEFNRDALSDMAKSQNSEMMGEMLVQQIEAANPDANISPEERQQLVDTLGNKYSGQYEDLTSIGNMNTHDDAMSEIVNGMVGDLNTLNNALNGISEDGYKKVGSITSTGQQALNALLGISGAAATTNSANDSNWVQEEQDHMNMDSFDSPYGGSSKTKYAPLKLNCFCANLCIHKTHDFHYNDSTQIK